MNIIKRFFQIREQKRTKKLQSIVQLIQNFYLQKHTVESNTYEEAYRKAREDINNLGITRVDLKGNTIIITLTRPGMLIGRHGDNINALQQFCKGYKIDIIEEKILSYLLPYVPDMDWDLMDY